MQFSSEFFLMFFFPAVLIFYFNHLIKSRIWKNAVLLIFSLVFYAWGEPFFVYIVIIVGLLNYLFALMMDRAGKRLRKLLLTVIILTDLLMLGIFKYLSFITENISFFTGRKGVEISIVLPLGISFFTFQIMSYVIDVYRGAAPQKNPLNVLLYTFMFPQMVAGPIVRYGVVKEEIAGRSENRQDFIRGITRFVFGLGKKTLIADRLAAGADIIFGMSVPTSVCTAWLGAILYTFQIYFDFSGYSDMAVGLGLIFGFHFPENFNYPYIAKSVTQFWRRWHISLSGWFRDYVYIPLGGSRVSKGKWIRNMLIVWLLTGIWHGAAYNFILWGLLYFFVLLMEKAVGTERIENHPIPAHIYTMAVVILAWVVFRCETLESLQVYLGSMFGIRAVGFYDRMFLKMIMDYKFIILYSAVFSCPFYMMLKRRITKRLGNWFEAAAVLSVFLLSLISILAGGYSPFIYFNF